jgi:GT2 family glycosyltransferase
MPADQPYLSVIIISYNTRRMTLDCLQTLYTGLDGLTTEVWVVDNASADGSADAIRESFPQVHLIENELNNGFGAANNQALCEARGAFILLLNSDAFPQPNSIATLANYLQRHPKVGLVGPRLLNKDGSLQRSCFRFPTPERAWLENLWISALLANNPVFGDYRRWAHDTERLVDHVIGACMLVRREAYIEAGGFDEAFFMYSEEADWEKRMRDKGWDIAFVPDAQVVHLGGASGVTEKARINGHFFESLDHYALKHHGLPGLISFRAAMTLGCFLRALLWIAVLIAVPRRRAAAAAKARLHSWLFLRQSTHWRLRPKASNSR